MLYFSHQEIYVDSKNKTTTRKKKTSNFLPQEALISWQLVVEYGIVMLERIVDILNFCFHLLFAWKDENNFEGSFEKKLSHFTFKTYYSVCNRAQLHI